MIKSLPFAALIGATLIAGTAAITTADAQKAKKTPAAAANTQAMRASKTTATTTAKPMALQSTMTSKTTTRTTAPAAKGRMVTAKLANGRTVTYNCSLPGNASKQACK